MKNLFNSLLNRYKSHPEAVIVSCFFNPTNSKYRLKAFNHFYDSIKHLNHQIVECVIGDTKPQLPRDPNIEVVHTPNLLWHKEALLNSIVKRLPEKFKYVFWVDADIIFTNKNWLVEGVKELQTNNIIQPFEYCVHLNKDELKPNCDNGIATIQKQRIADNFFGSDSERTTWRSFCANYVFNKKLAAHENYDTHGHVGFAWGARREVLDSVPLYDKALIGGADHIVAHAAAGHIPHNCIQKSFTENIEEVEQWSKEFYGVVQGKIGYVPGDLYHIWHGDISKRQYLKRVRDFTPTTKSIVDKHRYLRRATEKFGQF